MPYGDGWREQRKMVHGSLNVTAVKKWHNVQQDIAVLMAQSFLDSPEDFLQHIRL